MSRDSATEAQVNAARPDTSTWLGANAGSGKTRVLTDRVARLLLQDVPPERILCLTYTKAAASEMQNRLFQRLGAWAMMEDAELRTALAELGIEAHLDASALAKARALFAQAIEAPGGLKIQTIHAFCAAILRRFPLEARVSPQFKEMEERAAELLRARIVQDMADGPEAGVVAALARRLSDESFEKVTRALAGARDAFAGAPDAAALARMLDAGLGLPAGLTREGLCATVYLGGEAELLDDLVPLLLGSGTNDRKAGVRLRDRAADPFEALVDLEGVLLTGAGAGAPFSAKIDSFPTKALRNGAAAPLMPALEALMLRVEAARPQRLALLTREASADLHAFAAAFLPRYAAAKAARGWLDFDDLIIKTRDLLTDAKVAAWVLYKLDGGIDHILVDEAQDTSPVQWRVIELLAQEFTSGAGARSETDRTIFVVGDKKQSIYSFQGADPTGFDRMRSAFREKLDPLGAPFQDAALAYSFRSAEAILKLVDLTFQDRAASGFTPGAAHRAFHADMAGRVDLWPVVPPPEAPAERDWTDVLDRPDSANANVVLAGRIAAEIKRMIAEESLPCKDRETGQWTGRAVEPRDVLILVQNRTGIFPELIRACKAAELPIAGADVLKVGAELAVRDLAALMSWLALPEDDLSLATALRSPLFGWSEQALYTLCHGRSEPFLWRTLEARQDAHPETWAMLRDLRDAADFARPYDLIERILIRHEGRARLLSRLGVEAEDGINALLDQAIAYESAETPSLTGFLLWMQTDELKIKRQPDAASNQIRVMTVHGAKGLEAPIVFLPDCAQRKNELRDLVLPAGETVAMAPRVPEMPPALQEARAAALERQLQERDRLLYVAMTRAENWLIVAAAGKLGDNGEAWHDRVRTALEHAHALPQTFPGEIGAGLRFETGAWPGRPAVAPEDATPPAATLPAWLGHLAPIRPTPTPPLNPSRLGGAKALPGGAGLSEAEAMAHGTQVHLWLETLAADPAAADPDDPACAEAQRVIAEPAFGFLFAPGSLAEVTVSTPLPAGGRLRGAIDRLVVTPETVWAVDFKSNAEIPDAPERVPEGLLRQMGAYAAALAPLYPDREIRTALLWTRAPDLMVLPPDLVAKAFARGVAA
jgi:ATP-dependent helicase/nuclease subunit A